MKDGDIFEITIRRFYTDGERVAMPKPSRIVHITDADAARGNIAKLVERMIAYADELAKLLHGGVFVPMSKESVDALIAQEEGADAMASVEGMTRQ